MPTTKTLTVAQLLILSTAAQRPDHMVLPLPPTIRARGGAQRNLLGALLKMDLVAEVSVDDASVAWRTGEAGQHHGLRITPAGPTAAGAPEASTVESTDADADTSIRGVAGSTGGDIAAVEEPVAEQAAQEAPPRRPTGKLGEVLRAISAEAGATLTEITTLTGWLPHTARAAVTGLRKRGFDVALTPAGTAMRVVVAPGLPSTDRAAALSDSPTRRRCPRARRMPQRDAQGASGLLIAFRRGPGPTRFAGKAADALPRGIQRRTGKPCPSRRVTSPSSPRTAAIRTS